MIGSSDGGQRALGGFFYQLLGSGAEAVEVLGGAMPENANDDLRLEFSLENFGQDITKAIHSQVNKVITFGQYKYSASPRERLIGYTELVDIVEAFFKSEQDACQKNYKTVQFELVSNRGLTETAEELLISARNDDDDTWTARRPAKPEGERARPRHSVTGWNSMRAVFQSLGRKTLNEDDMVKVLKRHACMLGVLDDESQHGITQLVGVLFEKSKSEIRTVSLDELNEAIAGFHAPRTLTDVTVSSHMRKDLQYFQDRSWIVPETTVHRDVADEISVAILQHALIIVEGSGGTGKTVALYSAVKELLEMSEAPPPFGAAGYCTEVSEDWLGKLVSSWRGSGTLSHCGEGVERARMRLMRAGQSSLHPLLLLGLDAIDELENTSGHRARIQALLRPFVEEETRLSIGTGRPLGTLIVTCRCWTDLNLYDRSGFGERRPPGKIIQVGKFGPAELRRLAKQVLQDPVARIVARRANFLDGAQTSTDATLLSETGMAIGEESVDDEVFEAIRHPVVWNFFRELNLEDQKLAIAGEAVTLRKIAERLITWFATKAHIRHEGWERDVTIGIMQKVAVDCMIVDRPYYRKSDWINSAVSNGAYGEERARRLYEEALSAGLIARVGERDWQWRHRFISEFLSTLAG